MPIYHRLADISYRLKSFDLLSHKNPALSRISAKQNINVRILVISKKHLTKAAVDDIILKHSRGDIAQLVERLICIQEVLGSNPCISTTI